MLNVADGRRPTPRARTPTSPLLNVDCRRALAGAIDRERSTEERGAGLGAAGQRPVPARLARLPRGHRLPEVRRRRGQGGDGQVPRRARRPTTSSSRFNTTNDPFNVETNTLIISMWQEAFGDKVQGQDHADRAGPVHRPRPHRHVPGVRLAQPRRQRPRPAADVVAERVGGADRPAGAQLRALQGPRDRRGARHDQDEPRPGRPQGGRRGRSTSSSASRCTTCGWRWALWGIISQPYVNGVQANMLPDGGEGHRPRLRRPCTTSTRSGATTGSASSNRRSPWSAQPDCLEGVLRLTEPTNSTHLPRRRSPVLCHRIGRRRRVR